MTWTYSNDPSTSPKDALRFELGDVDQNDPLLSDEELNYCLTAESTRAGALARACEAIAQRFAREASLQVGKLSLDLTNRAKHWSERAREYRRKAAGLQPPAAPALDAAKEPYFRTGVHDL